MLWRKLGKTLSLWDDVGLGFCVSDFGHFVLLFVVFCVGVLFVEAGLAFCAGVVAGWLDLIV